MASLCLAVPSVIPSIRLGVAEEAGFPGLTTCLAGAAGDAVLVSGLAIELQRESAPPHVEEKLPCDAAIGVLLDGAVCVTDADFGVEVERDNEGGREDVEGESLESVVGFPEPGEREVEALEVSLRAREESEKR